MRRVFDTISLGGPRRGSILEQQEFVPTSQLIDTPPVKSPEKTTGTDVARTKSPIPVAPTERVLTEGKFFRVGSQKFHPRGVTYGPFKPDPAGSTFPKPEQAEREAGGERRVPDRRDAPAERSVRKWGNSPLLPCDISIAMLETRALTGAARGGRRLDGRAGRACRGRSAGVARHVREHDLAACPGHRSHPFWLR